MNTGEAPGEMVERGPPEYPLMEEGESLDDYFVRVGEDVPHVNITLYSAAHTTNADADGVREMLPSSDIYIPERFGWRQNDIEYLNMLSRGEASDLAVHEAREKGDSNVFSTASLDALEGTGAAVVAVDISEDDKGGYDMEDAVREFTGNNPELPFDDAIDVYATKVERLATAQVERERYMRAHIGPKILEAIRSRPELREKSEIRVFMPLGGSHSDIYHQLRAEGTDIERVFQHAPYIYTHQMEYMRRLMFGTAVDEEFKEQAFIERTVFLVNRKLLGHGSAEKELMSRVLVDLLDEDDRRSLYDSYHEEFGSFDDECKAKNKELKLQSIDNWEKPYRDWRNKRREECIDRVRQTYLAILKNKDIYLPVTPEEKIEFLRVHAPIEMAYIEQSRDRNSQVDVEV